MDNESNVAEPLTADVSQTDVTVDSSPSDTGVVADSPTAEEESQTSVEAVQQALDLGDENAVESGDQLPETEQAKPEEPQKTEGENEAQEETAEELYTMPEEVKSDRAKQRFEKLVSQNKEYKTQAEELSGRIEAVDKAFTQSNCSGEEISQLLDFGRMIKSTDVNELEAAWNLVEGMRNNLAVVLGKTEAGANILPAHLKERVDNFELTEQDAYQLANAERMQSQIANQQSAVNQQQQAQQQQQASVDQAVQAINTLEQDWSSKDPDFATKRDYLMTKIPEIQKQYPPEYWGNVLTQIYQAIPGSPAENTKQQRPNALRPSSIGAGQKAPGTEYEAVLQSLGMDF